MAALRYLLVSLLIMGLVGVSGGQATAAPRDMDHVLYWNSVLLDAYRANGGPPTVLTRAGAMMHAAIYDSVNSITPIGKPYLATYPTSLAERTDVRANIDWSAYTVLTAVFPKVPFTGALLTALADDTSGPGSVDVGLRSASAVLLARSNDESLEGQDPRTYQPPPPSPGQWQPTSPGPDGAGLSPHWGRVTPFVMASNVQFRPADPCGHSDVAELLASSCYADQVNDVRNIGRADSTTRTAEQTRIARFWANDLDGTYKPPGQLYALTQTISRDRHLGQAQNAKLFALVALGMADAAIVAWDRKYDTPIVLWRPVDAIHHADVDNNPATTADSSWAPLSADYSGAHFTPPFPSYTSGHSTLAGAWSAVLAGYLGTDAVTFVATTEDPHARGVTRTFTSLAAAGWEDALSRVYNGVHYRMDCEQGYASGRVLGAYVTGRL